MWKRIGILVAVLLIAGLGTKGWLATRPAPVAPKNESLANEGVQVHTSPEVVVTSVVETELSRRSRFTGTVAALREVVVATRVPGTVEWVIDDLGTRVQEGDALARIDETDLRLQVRQAEAVLAQAQAGVDRLRAGASEEEVRQAQATLQQADLGQRRAADNLARIETLYTQGAVSTDALEAARSQHAIATAQVEAARQVVAGMQRGARSEEIRAAEAQLAQAEVALEMAGRQLDDAVVRAPFAGVVAARMVQQGASAGSGTPVVSLVYLDEVAVHVGVTDRMVNHFRVGDSVDVTVQALGAAPLRGRVSGVSPVADRQTNLFTVRITLPNEDHRLKPGMAAAVEIAVERSNLAPVVARSAVTSRGGRQVVFVVNDEGVVEERSVSVTFEAEDRKSVV